VGSTVIPKRGLEGPGGERRRRKPSGCLTPADETVAPKEKPKGDTYPAVADPIDHERTSQTRGGKWRRKTDREFKENETGRREERGPWVPNQTAFSQTSLRGKIRGEKKLIERKGKTGGTHRLRAGSSWSTWLLLVLTLEVFEDTAKVKTLS